MALESRLGEVFVVDDGSFDGTGEAAQQAGGRVISLTSNRGKGGAVAAAATTIDADVLVLIDADLTGLKATHLEALARPVLSSETDMTRGVFVGGRWQTAAAQRLTPQLNGQRGIWRELLLSVPGLEATRYGLEVAITEHARRSGWTVQDVPLMGVSQVMKEEKRGFWRGVGTLGDVPRHRPNGTESSVATLTDARTPDRRTAPGKRLSVDPKSQEAVGRPGCRGEPPP